MINKRLRTYVNHILQRRPDLYTTYTGAYCHDEEGNAYNRELEVIVDMNEVLKWTKGEPVNISHYLDSIK